VKTGGFYVHIHHHLFVADRGWLARFTAGLAILGNSQKEENIMTPGHFGLAAGVKKWAPSIPLWMLFLATYLLDVIFLFLWIGGLESLAPIDPAHPNAYGGVLIHADYTHSLVGALLIAALAGWLAGRRWGKRGGMVIGAVVFSHWILDLLVHRPDLPILPGNFGNLPLLGFGLWEVPAVSMLIEAVLVIGGALLYYRTVTQIPVLENGQRRRAMTAGVVTCILLIGLLAANLLGI
jgi:membrane-bound metal-dependent hydrolase YbcI (DUF457 family)